jgi:hypothetical protein
MSVANLNNMLTSFSPQSESKYAAYPSSPRPCINEDATPVPDEYPKIKQARDTSSHSRLMPTESQLQFIHAENAIRKVQKKVLIENCLRI